MDLEQREAEKYRKLYMLKLYKRGPGINHVPFVMIKLGCKAGESIADYGCGDGRALVAFQDNGLEAIGTDIADSMMPDFKYYVPFVKGAMWNLKDFPVTDYAFSTHALEHLPTEKIDETLRFIERHTKKKAYLHVYHLPAVFDRWSPDGTLHLTEQPPEWWRERIGKYFKVEDETITLAQNGVAKETVFVCIPKTRKKKTPIPEVYIPQINENVFIVGHGPSCMDSGQGNNIDSYDNVIRFTWLQGQPPKDFGVKTDYVVSSLRGHADILNECLRPKKSMWVFGRPGQVDLKTTQWLIDERFKGHTIGCGRETWPWYYRYRDLGATGYIDPRQGAPGLIPSFSRGTAAIIMACIRIRPTKISLIGFDNVWAGTRQGYNDWTAMRKGEELRESGHDMRVERILLTELMEHYNVEIGHV